MYDWGTLKKELSLTETLGSLSTKVMQYTGLKDKNNREIYEGDILQADDTGTFLGDKFYEGLHRYWKTKAVNDIRNCFFREYTDRIEVIGNIYEIPELLEGESYETS